MNAKVGERAANCLPGKGSPFLGGQESKNDDTRITLIANAGVLIEHKGVGILVDGIHHEKGHSFSRVSSSDIKLMRRGADVFKKLDYLLFTHEHPDHFSPQYVSELLQHRSVKGLFLPDERNGSPDLTLLLEQIRERAIPFWTGGLKPGETKRVVLSADLIVTVIGTRHMGPQFRTICNDCFLLTLSGQNLLFTGDADHVAEYFTSALMEVCLDAVFVNPIFYHNSNGQEIINEIFHPRHVFIYHMPFGEDDTMHFSYMVKSDIKKYARPDIQTHVLDSTRQSFSLSAPER